MLPGNALCEYNIVFLCYCVKTERALKFCGSLGEAFFGYSVGRLEKGLSKEDRFGLSMESCVAI